MFGRPVFVNPTAEKANKVRLSVVTIFARPPEADRHTMGEQ